MNTVPLTRTAFTYLAFRPEPDKREVHLLKHPHGITVYELYHHHFDEPDSEELRTAFEDSVRAHGKANNWGELTLVWCETYREYVGSQSS
ncbi:MAG: hypothetical protein K2W95_07180 [Candidatus Obscuribacterales bacterium]|nr:hypothetical protein [Candidatus Obscuribacterales bacterium]